MAVEHETTEREWPGIDPVLVRMTLADLAERYGARIAAARSRGERASLVHCFAIESRRELDGLHTEEARKLIALFSAIAERASM